VEAVPSVRRHLRHCFCNRPLPRAGRAGRCNRLRRDPAIRV